MNHIDIKKNDPTEFLKQDIKIGKKTKDKILLEDLNAGRQQWKRSCSCTKLVWNRCGFCKVQERLFEIVQRHNWENCPPGMAIRVLEFSKGGYKIRKIFAQETTYPKEMIEFWVLD